jgi:hypothetical protein
MIEDARMKLTAVDMMESPRWCSWPGSLLELVCQMMMYGVKNDPKSPTMLSA